MDDLEFSGYVITDVMLAGAQCEQIASSLPAISAGRTGVRDLIDHPTVARLLMHRSLGGAIWSMAGRDLVAVKATLFDHGSGRDWRGQWHQDRAIGVRERMDVAGYGPWSKKAGAVSVEPPAEVLMQMLAVRIYLDDPGDAESPLAVIPGSHMAGKLDAEHLQKLVEESASVRLDVPRGALVVMRPLLVHASQRAATGGHRRCLHIECAPMEAISPLRWPAAVPLRRAA